MRVLIAGGGIGGLAVALSLHAVGVTDVTIVEKAAGFDAAGVGLNLLPNAVRELTDLGLGEQLGHGAVATQELKLVSRFGKLIWSEPRGLAAGHRWPQLSVHRGHLQSVLLQAVRERLGCDAVVSGVSLSSFAPRPGGKVRVVLQRAGTGETEARDADLLIGADGIRSAVRACAYPREGAPPGNGMVLWRGTSWAEPYLTGASMVVTGTDTERIVLYPIAKRPGRSGALINWVVARPAAKTLDGHDGWRKQVAVSEVLDHFGGWRFDWLDIPAILGAAESVYRCPMQDRDSLPCWTFGQATLLGDAAHAMYPVGSNGATQAIVDARALAAALAGVGDIPQALARYEAERRPAMTQLQASNRQGGPETAITVVHRRAPSGFDNLRDVISRRELAAISANYAETAGFDVDHVNGQRPPSPENSNARHDPASRSQRFNGEARS